MATNFSPTFNDRNVSYFVGVDSEDISPQTLRVGDRNLVFKSQPLEAGLFALAEKFTVPVAIFVQQMVQFDCSMANS